MLQQPMNREIQGLNQVEVAPYDKNSNLLFFCSVGLTKQNLFKYPLRVHITLVKKKTATQEETMFKCHP